MRRQAHRAPASTSVRWTHPLCRFRAAQAQRCQAQPQALKSLPDTSLPAFRYRVSAKQAAAKLRLDAFLAAQIATELAGASAGNVQDVSRAKIQASIAGGLVRINGRPASKASQQLKPGDILECTLPPPPPLRAEPEAIPLDVRYEDEHVIVVNKPAGMVVHVAPGHHSGTLVNALLHHCALPGLNLEPRAAEGASTADDDGDGLDPDLDDEEGDEGEQSEARMDGGAQLLATGGSGLEGLGQQLSDGGSSASGLAAPAGRVADDPEPGAGLASASAPTPAAAAAAASRGREGGGGGGSSDGSSHVYSSCSSAVLRPGIVHRLDKGTSGLLVVAKTETALTRLQAQFKARTVDRLYVSITVGCPGQPQGRVETNIVRDPRDRKRMAAAPYGSGRGRTAASGFTVESPLAGGGAALVRWKLDTGRTHQIRVHAKHIGHPLLGDDTYGGAGTSSVAVLSRSFPADQVRSCLQQLGRPALHALTLGFDHPITGRRLAFEQPPPEDFLAAVRQLQGRS